MRGGRFDSQASLFGDEGQGRIMQATVGVAGCGALRVTLVTVLAEAGVSRFVLADQDYPEITDLNTQFIYAMSDPRPKAQRAAQWITAVNPLAELEVHAERIDEGTKTMFDCCDIIADCLCDPKASAVLSDYAAERGKTVVYADVCGFKGRVAVSAPGSSSIGEIVGKAEPYAEPRSNVGAAASAIASIQALEILKAISGAGSANAGRLVEFDLESMKSSIVGRGFRNPGTGRGRFASPYLTPS